MEHSNNLDECVVCAESKRPRCTECGHALTGDFDYHGRTTCEVCGEPIWLGVGDGDA